MREAIGFWTDARNGRGSGGPASPQPGRNPACEQADVWLDYFDPLVEQATGGGSQFNELFVVTPCPEGAFDPHNPHGFGG